MSLILLHLLPATFYVALAVFSLPRTGARHSDGRHIAALLLFTALCSHAFALGEVMLGDGEFHFGLSIALSLTLWLAMLFYSLESLVRPIKPLLSVVSIASAVFVVLPILSPGHPHTLDAGNWAFRMHVVVAMLAYSLFTLAVFHALLIAAAERHLHGRTSVSIEHALPPLLTLERLLFRLISTAFTFLTLTVASGVLFSEQIFGKPFTLTHKAVFGIASWLLFAILLAGRWHRGWRGKTATHWLLAGFACLLLAYAGSRFVLEYILNRSI
ncbi:inner membrane protein YpjD [Uliginosibacterium paludis]|uniref:Cytochrome c biogenesis protein CcsA n=1 Tax=Uliginosibacterium paludis TaxID=1615952 RepID=A0ABV2CKN4_9RHOO